jgi:hypothetical protein
MKQSFSEPKYHFSPASSYDELIFGAQRPGYPNWPVKPSEVAAWIGFMRQREISRIVCLLPEEQLRYYSQLSKGLLGSYHNTFGLENVLHASRKGLSSLR